MIVEFSEFFHQEVTVFCMYSQTCQQWSLSNPLSPVTDLSRFPPKHPLIWTCLMWPPKIGFNDQVYMSRSTINSKVIGRFIFFNRTFQNCYNDIFLNECAWPAIFILIFFHHFTWFLYANSNFNNGSSLSRKTTCL